MTSNTRTVLDLSTLPVGAVGPRAPLWWGTMGLILIESTVLALCIMTYFYLRMRYTAWPPADAGLPDYLIPTLTTLSLIGAVIPQILLDRSIETENKKQVQRLLLISTIFAVLACILRVWDFRALNCDWQEHSYGSITWALIGFHSTHMFASTIENLLMALNVSEVPLDEKHRLDLNVNAIYWYFVVIAWLVIYAVVWGAVRVL